MSNKKSWIDTNRLLQPDYLRDIFSKKISEDDKTVVQKVRGLKMQTPVAAPPPEQAPAQAPAAPPAAPQQAAAPPPSPSLTWNPIPKMGEIPHSKPSLASRARPDLPSAAERHQGFVGAYSDPQAANKSLRQHKKGSLNVVFHGQMDSGHQYIAKPHGGIAHRDRETLDPETLQALQKEAPDNASRHDATYELMSHMGAHHMVVPGIATNMHGRHQFKGPDPDENDSDQKRLTMASAHAGQPAHVQEFVPGAVDAGHATPEQLDKVDAEHRLHGMVANLLMGSQDAHSGNVLIHPAGHPVMIDHDQTLATQQAGVNKQNLGKDAFRSAFSPGSPLDYQAKLPKDANGKVIPVGTNFPPRMMETLQRAAEGYYSKGPGKLGLSPADAEALQKNAHQLLAYGLEGVLERRHDMDAEDNALQAKKQAANDALDAQARPATPSGRKPRKRR
jgi:hypothetical protein